MFEFPNCKIFLISLLCNTLMFLYNLLNNNCLQDVCKPINVRFIIVIYKLFKLAVLMFPLTIQHKSCII